MTDEIMMSLRESLRDAFEPEYHISGSIKAIHWDANAQVLSFQGYVTCINVWLNVQTGDDTFAVVEFNNQPGGADRETLWKND